MTYDGEGHRIRLVETPAGANPTVTTTDFTYQGDAVVREVSVTGTTTVTRAFTVDEAGAIVTMTRTTTGGGSSANDGTYLVTWNGHGDALGLARIKSDGTLELANTWTYDTWGEPQPTTSHPNSANSNAAYGDLGFRYLYVGRFDVQWDDYSSAGLLYMHARHYHPEFGRFLQPDPAALEANLYTYAENSPVTKVDPSGLATVDSAGGNSGYSFLRLDLDHRGKVIVWVGCNLTGFRFITWVTWKGVIKHIRTGKSAHIVVSHPVIPSPYFVDERKYALPTGRVRVTISEIKVVYLWGLIASMAWSTRSLKASIINYNTRD